MKLVEKIKARQARVGVMGLGYVGLPLVETFIAGGFPVLGYDTDQAKVDTLLAGQTYIEHIPPERVQATLDRGFEPTTDPARLAECDAILICVPTPLTKHREPDMKYVVATCETLIPHLRADQIIILESTTYPGTSDELMVPILERSGLAANEDFWVAYSPEREDPANPDYSTATIPKVVGADHDTALEAASALYAAVVTQIVPVSSSRAAEATKILENTFRAVNIALVNELKLVFERMGVDIWEVIDAASTKPFGFMRFTPGPGLGGHCIPIDPFYLTWKAREVDIATRFIEMAGEVNRAMPHYVVSRTMEAFSSRGRGLAGARLLIIGLSYKKNVDDDRESPSYKLMELFEQTGASVAYHDPHIPTILRSREYARYAGRESQPIRDVSGYDAVIVATDHDAIDWDTVLAEARLIIDTRGVYKGQNGKVIKA
jgi:UDP-N-acetyl-D-glucosamine dehydrogenase